MKAILIPTSNENCLFRIKKMTLEWSAYSENVHCYGYLDHHFTHEDHSEDVIGHTEKHPLLLHTHRHTHRRESMHRLTAGSAFVNLKAL